MALHGVEFLPADQGGNDAPVVLENATLAELAQDGIGSGLFPVQFRFAKFDQIPGMKRGVGPDDIGKAGLHHAQFQLIHKKSSFGLLFINLVYQQ